MIHLNIGSNLNSKFGDRFNNITIAVNLLQESKFNIKKLSNFYETPSYPNKSFPNYLNIGVLGTFKESAKDTLAKLVCLLAPLSNGDILTNLCTPDSDFISPYK